MKCMLFIIILLLACIISGAANAEFISFDNPPMTREERLVKLQVLKHQQAFLSIHIQGHCMSNCLKPIDGSENAIEISQERTSPPDGYISLPVKRYNKEIYEKNN